MSFFVAQNTISMSFLLALITHNMNLFVAVKHDFLRELCDFFNISQTKLLKPLSLHEYTHQMQTYCEEEKNHWTVPLTRRSIFFSLSFKKI